MRRKNKKAQAFAFFMTIATVILVGYALFTFITVENKVSLLITTPSGLLELYDETDRFVFYAKQSAKLTSQQAFQEIAENQDFANCQVFSGYMVIKDECVLSKEELEEKFLFHINENFIKFLESYPDKDFVTDYEFLIEGDNLVAKAEEKEVILSPVGKDFPHSARYRPDFSFELELELKPEDFIFLYEKAKGCKAETELEKCMENENYSVVVTKNGYLFFDIKTKKSFFFTDEKEKFAPIEIKFALEK